MKLHTVLKSVLILATALFFVASSVKAAPKKKTQFELFVPVASQPIKSDQFCGNLGGALSSGEFFEGLQRLGSGRRIEFRKDSQPVKEFPSKIAIALAGNITQCGSAPASDSQVDFVQPGNGSSPRTVSDFMSGLKFTAVWKNPRGVQQVSNLAVTKSVSNDSAWRVNDQIPMRFALQVPSQGIPLTSQLMISMYGPSGVKLATFNVGVLARFPKHHLKTIHAQQSE